MPSMTTMPESYQQKVKYVREIINIFSEEQKRIELKKKNLEKTIFEFEDSRNYLGEELSNKIDTIHGTNSKDSLKIGTAVTILSGLFTLGTYGLLKHFNLPEENISNYCSIILITTSILSCFATNKFLKYNKKYKFEEFIEHNKNKKEYIIKYYSILKKFEEFNGIYNMMECK